MRVQDVKPTRMVAAQEAAKSFLREVPDNIDVGLVTFAGSAQVAQQATIDRPSLIGAIDAIQMQLGTAVGSAIVLCLAELFPDHGIDLGEMTLSPQHKARSLDERAKAPPSRSLRWRQAPTIPPRSSCWRRPPSHRGRHAGSREDGR
jgi:Ca-activated chloride channel homolog